MKSEEISCINCKIHLENSIYLESLVKRFLKSIPKTTLIQYLVELKILKKDYVTNEIKLINEKNAK